MRVRDRTGHRIRLQLRGRRANRSVGRSMFRPSVPFPSSLTTSSTPGSRSSMDTRTWPPTRAVRQHDVQQSHQRAAERRPEPSTSRQLGNGVQANARVIREHRHARNNVGRSRGSEAHQYRTGGQLGADQHLLDDPSEHLRICNELLHHGSDAAARELSPAMRPRREEPDKATRMPDAPLTSSPSRSKAAAAGFLRCRAVPLRR